MSNVATTKLREFTGTMNTCNNESICFRKFRNIVSNLTKTKLKRSSKH